MPELLEEMANTLKREYYGRGAAFDSELLALACLPVFEKWLREKEAQLRIAYKQTSPAMQEMSKIRRETCSALADELAAMRRAKG